jgi:hypothetical protein
VFEQRMWELRSKGVVHGSPLLAEGHQASDPQHAKRVRDSVLGRVEHQCQVTDTEPLDRRQGEQDPGAHRIGDQSQQPGQSTSIVSRDQVLPGSCKSGGVDAILVVRRCAWSYSPHIRMIIRIYDPGQAEEENELMTDPKLEIEVVQTALMFPTDWSIFAMTGSAFGCL